MNNRLCRGVLATVGAVLLLSSAAARAEGDACGILDGVTT